MTTRVKLECPDNSHWYVKVTTENKVWDDVAKKMTDEWRPASVITLKQGEKHETYIHDSCRLVVEEIVPEGA